MRKLLLLASVAVVLSWPAWNARAESPEQYKLNLEAHFGQVKGLDAAKLPAEKHVKLWQDFLDRFPHDNPHADEARERIHYWTGQKDGQPAATQAPSAAPPATQPPAPPATQTPLPPATAAPSPLPAPTQAASPAPPEPPPGSPNPGPGPPGGPISGLENKLLCAYVGSADPQAVAIGTSPADRLALQAVEDIAALTGQRPDFELLAGDVETALAVLAPIDGQMRKLVVYNPGFVASLRGPARGRWLVYGVLAHEMAHHMSQHMSQAGPVPDDELWADDFSGMILFRMGSSLEQAQAAIQALRGAPAPGYPSRKARRVAVANGWRGAADKDPGRRRGPGRSKKPGRPSTGMPD